MEKAYKESLKPDTIVVVLVHARTDTRWFHDWVYHKAEIRFIKGRLKFDSGKNNAPFPSMLAIYDSGSEERKKKYPWEMEDSDGRT